MKAANRDTVAGAAAGGASAAGVGRAGAASSAPGSPGHAPGGPPIRGEGDTNAGPRRARWRAEALDDATRSILDADDALFLHQSLSTPCLDALVGAEGSELVTASGRRILDFHGNAVHQVGFSNPRVLEAIRAQLAELPFSTRRYANRPAVDLARALVERAPGDLSRVLFTTGGATAISAAIQLARVATGRHKLVAMWDAFHGATLDTISVGGEASFRSGIGPLLPGVEHVPPPDPLHCPFRCRERGATCDLACADYIAYVLEKEGDVAAVVAETVRSVPYVPPPGYWRRVREACDRHGTLLILDEIPTALGRTGRFFAFEHFGVIPDIVVIGKGLGGGVWPIAALIARERLNVAGDRSIGHVTHEKNPVGAAAGLATIREIDERGLVARAAELGERTLGQLRELARPRPLIRDVRGIGLLLGVELDVSRMPDAADLVMYEALGRGLNMKVTMGSVLQLTPPLTVTHDEMQRALRILDEALASVEAGLDGRPVRL